MNRSVRHGLVERGLDALFDAAVGMESWEKGLSSIAVGFGATAAAMVPESKLVIPLGIPTSGNASAAFSEFVSGGWYVNDIRARRTWSLAKSGKFIMYEQELTTPQERSSEPYYQEFFCKFDMQWLLGVTFSVRGEAWSLGLFRGSAQGAFEPADGPALGRLRANLSRVIRLAYAFRGPENSALTTILDRAHIPMVGFDPSGQISILNQKAVEALAPFYRIKGNRLQAVDQAADKRLQTVIREATTSVSSATQREPSAVVTYEAGRPVHVLELITMPRNFMSAFSGFVVVGLIRNVKSTRQSQAPRSVDALRQAFGLTVAEAKVASVVGTGLGLPEAARNLSIGYETARTHLAKVFGKLGISRQAELVEIIALIDATSR